MADATSEATSKPTSEPTCNPSSKPYFTLFPKLPKEIRFMIWEAALPGPRVVCVKQKALKKTIGEWEDEHREEWPNNYDVKFGLSKEIYMDQSREDMHYAITRKIFYDSKSTKYKEGHLVGYQSNCSAPEILSVCHESFEIVSAHYTRIFKAAGAWDNIWFNFEIDTLYLDWKTFSYQYDSHFDHEDISAFLEQGTFRPLDLAVLSQKVNRLALAPPNTRTNFYQTWTSNLLKTFKKLERLTFVISRYDMDTDDSSPISFIDPIDIRGFIHNCRFSPRLDECGCPIPLETDRINYTVHEKLNINNLKR